MTLITARCTGVHVAGARSGARLSGAGARCGVGQCPVCATHPPPAPPAPGSVGQSRGSVIIMGDCGLSALVIIVKLARAIHTTQAKSMYSRCYSGVR